MTATEATELDCQACAACCHGDDGWVHLDASDDARADASPALAALVVRTRSGGYVKVSLRMVAGACAALHGQDGRYACAVYEDRPSVCREVERGSEACRSARRAQGW